MNNSHRNRTLALGLLAFAAAARSFAGDTVCKTVFDSMIRQAKTPNHQFFSQISARPGSKPEVSEIINTGTKRYLLRNGKWSSVPESPDEMIKRQQENIASSTSTCRWVRDETVEGTSAGVYSEHSKNDTDETEGLIWIAKGSGLPVREQIERDPGDGPTGKTHIEIRIVYTGVAAPAGMK